MVKSGIKCRHEWEIETAQGPTSAGTCRLCGEHREGFKNNTDEDNVFFINWETIHDRYKPTDYKGVADAND